MSSQKGNTSRTRPQKFQNRFAFKNTLHDTSHKTKTINSLQICNVCERCKKIIEWKIKYKKYKPLKAPGKCNKCDQKTVRHSYHTMCQPCARDRNVCPKCGDEREIVSPQPSKEEQIKLDGEMQRMLKALPERKRRTFIRYMNKQTEDKKKKKKKNNHDGSHNNENDGDDSEDGDISTEGDEEYPEFNREDLLNKLKSLTIEKDEDDDEFDSDFSNDDSDSD